MPRGISFIPAAVAMFHQWQETFVKTVTLYKSGWGWTPAIDAEWLLLTDTAGKKKKKWDAIYDIIATTDFKPSDEVAMMAARKDYEFGKKTDPADTSLRIFITRYIRNSPLVTVEQKRQMGLTVPDDTLTATSDFNAKISGVDLEGSAKSKSHLVQKSLVIVPGQKSKAKGEGVDAIEVFMAIAEASVKTAPAIKDFQLVGEVKRGVFTHTFLSEQEGMRAWYFVRRRIKGKVKTYGPPSVTWSKLID
jgi:hypothetical protein